MRFPKLGRILANPRILKTHYLGGIENTHAWNCFKVEELIGKPKTVIDIGANQGAFIKASKYIFPDAKIIAFEPVDYLCEKLGEDIEKFNFALSDEEGGESFNLNIKDNGSSSLLEYEDGFKSKEDITKIKIRKIRFDSLNIKIERPCYVKMDVEGYDTKIIEGFGDRLKEVDVIQVEWFFTKYYKNQMKLSEIMKTLENYGFNGCIQTAVNQKNGGPTKCDMLFFRAGNIGVGV